MRAGGEGTTEVNDSTSADMGKALTIISMLQKNAGQDVMDLTEDDLLLLADFKRRLDREERAIFRVCQCTNSSVSICSLRPGICYKNSGDPSSRGRRRPV